MDNKEDFEDESDSLKKENIKNLDEMGEGKENTDNNEDTIDDDYISQDISEKPLFKKHKSPKRMAIFILIYEIMHLLFKTKFMNLIDLNLGFLNYWILYPNSFSTFLIWIISDIFVILLCIGIWYWDYGNIPKMMTFLSLITIQILSAFFIPIFILVIGWLFLIILSIQLLPKFSNKKITYTSIKDIPEKMRLIPVFTLLLLIIPIVATIQQDYGEPYTYEVYQGIHDFDGRKDLYLSQLIDDEDSWASIARIYKNLTIEEDVISRTIRSVLNKESDFSLNYLLRAWYLNNKSHVLSSTIVQDMESCFKDARYWYTEPGNPNTIFWTENHQLSYHTAELLAGQILKNVTFTKSDLTGLEHMQRVESILNTFLDWRGRYGFTEWHSSTYLGVDIVALSNLVEFAENQTIATKAAMLLDIICFDFAMNYFEWEYAATQGRFYGRNRIGVDSQHIARIDGVSDASWILLGVGAYVLGSVHNSGVSLATSEKYVPPLIFEHIANDSKLYNENRETSGFNIHDAESLNISYTEENIPLFWSTSAVLNEKIVDLSLPFYDKYGISPMSNIGPGIPDILKLTAKLRGITISELCHEMEEFTRGIGMEKVDTYTYRTPYYQLSGAQDYHKGFGGVQEQVWQATLSQDTYVFTNGPGAFDFKGGSFSGGWKPRGGFYKNVGILLYDHKQPTIESKLITDSVAVFQNFMVGNRPYNHAYFPRWAFDNVIQKEGWTFGEEDGAYVGLYSHNPTFWANDIELVSWGKSNCWIVELGSVEDYTDFQDFISSITENKPKVEKLDMGYSVEYHSPSRGLMEFAWEGDLTVDGTDFPLTTNLRWDNNYSQTDYGSWKTEISFETESLILNFKNGTRNYSP